MIGQPLQTELAKLLREQEAITAGNPGSIEQNNRDVWTLRSKYACGSTWGKDPAFDKWWVKQVAKARQLNIVRQIMIAAAVAAVAGCFIYNAVDERLHPPPPDTEETQQDDIPTASVTKTVDGHTYVWTESDNPQIGWHWLKEN
jgi:hypothetical protein